MTEKQKTMDAIQSAGQSGTAETSILPSLACSPTCFCPIFAPARVVEFARAAARSKLRSNSPELPYIVMRPATWRRGISTSIMRWRRREPNIWRLPSGFPLRAVVRAALVPERHGQDRLHGGDFHAFSAQVELRHPFFLSTQREREALFGTVGRPPAARWSDDELRIGA